MAKKPGAVNNHQRQGMMTARILESHKA